MANKFLKAKHWQIFILTFGIPMIFQFVALVSIFANFRILDKPNPEEMFNNIKFIPFLLLLFFGLLFTWFWAVGTGLQKKIPENAKMKTNLFKVFLFIPIIYMLILGIALRYTVNGLFQVDAKSNMVLILVLFCAIFLLHLFSVFCILYCIYFVARTIKTAELQRTVTFSDFIPEFFMVWFSPVGIWVIQPRINKLAE